MVRWAADELLKRTFAADQGSSHDLNVKDALRTMSRLCFNCYLFKAIEVIGSTIGSGEIKRTTYVRRPYEATGAIISMQYPGRSGAHRHN